MFIKEIRSYITTDILLEFLCIHLTVSILLSMAVGNDATDEQRSRLPSRGPWLVEMALALTLTFISSYPS